MEKIPGQRRLQIQFQYHSNPLHAHIASSDGQLLALRTRDGKIRIAPVTAMLGNEREQVQAEIESLGGYVSHSSSGHTIYVNFLDARIAALISRLNVLGDVSELTIRGRQIEPKALASLFRGAGITDANMRHLKTMTQLHTLILSQTGITDAGLKYIGNLQRLRQLTLGNTGVTGSGLSILSDMHELQKLELQATKLTETGLEALRQLKNLRQLDLSSTHLAEQAARQLAGCQNLQYLTLYNADLTDDTLATLDNLPNLESLSLSQTEITGAGFEKLSNLPKLRSIHLWNSKLDDAGLQALCKFSQLRSLSIQRTKVTDAGLASLAQLKKLHSLVKKLHSLECASNDITGKGLAFLSALPEFLLYADARSLAENKLLEVCDRCVVRFFPAQGGNSLASGRLKTEQLQQVVRQTCQSPLPLHFPKTAKQKLTKLLTRFDLTEHRFDLALPSGIHRPALLGAEFSPHAFLR